MYRSGTRSSVSSHRPKDSGGGGPRTGRSSGSSSGPAGRASPPSSGSSSSRTPARRPRSPSGHRGRRASPSPPRGRRGSPSPPRGRRASPSPPRARRGSPSPPRGRRLFPPGQASFRGSSRGESRADFARDGRGDHPGDSGSRRRSPGLRSDSSLEQSLRITVGNDHFCVGTPERQRLSDRLGSPADNLEDMDRDDLTDDSVFTRSSQCSQGLERYISREEGPLSPFLGQLDEDYRARETFLRRSDYSPHISCRDELLRGTERIRDKLKASYSIRSEERNREAKRPRYDDTEKIHSMAGDHPSFTSGTRNYRQRRRSPSPRFLDPEFRELDLARRKREEEEERSRSLSQELVGVDSGGTSCPIPGLSGVLTASEPGYSLHRPEEVSVMPKKSILKKRIEVDMEPSMQLESFSSSTSSSQDHPLYSGTSSLPLSGAIAAFASEIESNKETMVETTLKESHDNLYQWGPLPGIPKKSPLREKFGSFLCHKEKLDTKAEGPERHTDFLLPHERASQDGSGFSRILSMLADSTSTQEKRRRSFPDIEDEEKFLYGDEEEDLKAESPPKPLGGSENDVMRQKASSLPSSAPAVKLESLEETNPEYTKIHDLLKTIGLDIGVAEISKLAARTQERLHGKKPSSRSSTDRRSSVDRHFSVDHRSSVDRHFSSDRRSSDPHRLESREAHHINTHSSEMPHPHPTSPVDSYLLTKNSPPFLKSDRPVGQISGPKVVGSGFQSPVAVRCMLPSAPSAPLRLPHPASLSQFHMSRTTQFAAARIPPNYQGPAIPPASFDAYRHYMAYAASRWPMYPTSQPSNHPLPEPHRVMPVTKQATRSRPNLRVIPTVTPDDPKQEESVLGSIPAVQVPVQVSSIPSLVRYNPEKISDEKNRASQKQKVIEEREKLKNDREARQKKMYYLRTELERLHKQQGEMLRKKRREKDGHKDPLLVEVSRLQDNIMKDIAELRQEAEEAEKKQSELDKVAQILGINIFDKSQKSSNDSKEATEKPGRTEKSKSPEKVSSSSNSSNKESKVNNEKSHTKSPKPAESSQPAAKQSDEPITAYEYYDAGNHWCKDCNTICGTMFDFFTHMHNKKHTQEQFQKSSGFQKEGLQQTSLPHGGMGRSHRDYRNDERSCDQYYFQSLTSRRSSGQEEKNPGHVEVGKRLELNF